MDLALSVLVGAIALQHLSFFVLESFLWRTPFGRKVFKMSAEQAEATAVLAVNQGVYNAFLAAGLAWSVLAEPGLALPLRSFFLGCVLVAGLVGGLTAARSILLVQALPAAIALAGVLAFRT